MYSETDVPNQSGKTFFITGANTGLGFESARVLAGKGARVLIGCRTESKAQAAIDEIKSKHPQADLKFVALDLTSLDSIRAAAEEVNKEERLDVLLNNAGIMTPPFYRTQDGFEAQIGVNHLGHFALTGLLLEKLMAHETGRVVTVSSLAHKKGKIDFDDFNCDGKYSAMARYEMSKYANALFSVELQRRLQAAGSKVISVACHPGIADTELSRDFGAWFKLVGPMIRIFKVFNTPAEGALPNLLAATGDVEGGAMYGPVKRGETARSAGKGVFEKHVYDTEVARKLWEKSEQLTGVSYAL